MKQIMKNTGKIGLVASLTWMSLSAAQLIIPSIAHAQVTTGTIRGYVYDTDSNPQSGVQVEILDIKTNTNKTAITNDSGGFVFTGMKAGGPYRISTNVSGQSLVQDNLTIKTGNNDTIRLVANPREEIETIEVTGARLAPKMSGKMFDEEDIRKAPSISRDPKDVAQLSPDTYLDGDRLSIGGNNNRFNSITVDGIRQDDDFGLNGSGYPTQRSPISMDAVEEISVNKTPFDVRYGKFLGGNINIVTKSGTNEFAGSAYVVHTNDKLKGKRTVDKKIKGKFNETTYGVTFGGPVIMDKLHFFLSFENLMGTEPGSNGVAGSGAINEASRISGDDVASIQRISNDVYGFNAGEVSKSLEEKDQKFLAKLNWEINTAHRAELSYQRSSGNEIRSTSASEGSLDLSSNWYDNKQTLTTYSLKLLSDWTYNFSTKLEITDKKVVNNQDPLNGRDFMEASISVNKKAKVDIGPDPYRHANYLENKSFRVNTEANYLHNQHLFTGGIEFDRVDIENLLVWNSNGQAEYDSIVDFENKNPNSILYNNSVTNDVNDNLADWGYSITTFYLQDEMQISNKLIARAGLRFENYSSKGNITKNERFHNEYGFYNDADIDGKQVILPRLGLEYQHNNRLSINGGVGMYSGGGPSVWLSNNYTNDGVTVASNHSDDAGTISGFDGRNIPEALKNFDTVDGDVNALDPDFKIPQTMKFALGTDYRADIPFIGDNFLFSANYTYSKVKHGIMWKDLKKNNPNIANNTPITQAPDGRDIYDTENFNIRRGHDLLLTNTDKGFSHVASLTTSKYYESGFNFSTSYSWQKVQDVMPGTSSTAASNYKYVAIDGNPNDPALATSDFERRHRFLIMAGYDYELLDNLVSSFSLFLERRSGQPFSFTFGDEDGNTKKNLAATFGEDDRFSDANRQLLYIPKGDGSDVIYGDEFDKEAFEDFIDEYDLKEYRGKILPRNSHRGDWVDHINFRYSQELPGYKDHHKANITLDIENLPNLIDNQWGQVRNPNTLEPVVEVEFDRESGKYKYTKFHKPTLKEIQEDDSVWKMQLTATYNF